MPNLPPRPPWIARALARARRLLAVLLWPLAAAAQPAADAACPPAPATPSAEALQAAAQRAQDRGLLWRLQKDGRTAWLFGSVHLGRLDWALPGPTLRAALQASDTVALELDVLDPRLPARLQPPPGTAMPALAAPLRERLARQVRAACLPDEAAGQHPVMLGITLTLLAARRDGLDAGYAQEFVLAGFAMQTGKTVVGLETPEAQRDALLVSDPAEVNRLVGAMLDQLDSGQARRNALRLAEAWARSDLDTLADHERWCDCVATDADRAWLKRLNDDRNPNLADRIAALHAEGRAVFAAVGVLHMTGPQALPRLLAERGFTVERVR